MRIGLIGVNPAAALAIDNLLKIDRATEFTYYDDNKQKHGNIFHGVNVAGNVADVQTDFIKGNLDAVLICFGDKNLRLKNEIYKKFSGLNIPVINAIHPVMVEGYGVQKGQGNIIGPNVTIGQEVRIGNNSIIWSGVVIEHNTRIGDCCYFGPNATVSGFADIGDYVMIGSGSVILPAVRIGSGAVIGAGAVVTKNVDENITVAGVPARPLHK